MKVVFTFQKNNSSKPQKQKITFEAGLTSKIMQEIKQADVLEISRNLTKKGIPADFKENQVIAWCCDKVIKIFEQLNEKYKLKLALPKGIYVEDFEKLNIDNSEAYGFCNLQPIMLKKDSDEIVPSRVLFFNTFETKLKQTPEEYQWLYNWNYIDTISDFRYATKQAGTDSFLDIFLHESSHASHENRLLAKLGLKALEQTIDIYRSKEEIKKYQSKYDTKISQICDYALTNPFEAIACDMSRTIENCLGKGTLMPIKNPFPGTPYEKMYFWQPKRIKIPVYSDQDRPLIEILRNFWNGKFD